MAVLGRNAIGLGGLGRFDLERSLTNRAHLEIHARLLAGQKFYHLRTTNASLGDFMVALSYYANKEVLLLGQPEGTWAGRFGPFDSTASATRYGAASAIKERLVEAEWHLLRLADGKLMIVSEADRRRLVPGEPMAHPPPIEANRQTERLAGKGFE